MDHHVSSYFHFCRNLGIFSNNGQSCVQALWLAFVGSVVVSVSYQSSSANVGVFVKNSPVNDRAGLNSPDQLGVRYLLTAADAGP